MQIGWNSIRFTTD